MLPSVVFPENNFRLVPVPLVQQVWTSLNALNCWKCWIMEYAEYSSLLTCSIIRVVHDPPSSFTPRRSLSQAPEELTQAAATLLTGPSKPANICHNCHFKLRHFIVIQSWTAQGDAKLSTRVLQMRLRVICSQSAFIAEYLSRYKTMIYIFLALCYGSCHLSGCKLISSYWPITVPKNTQVKHKTITGRSELK
jgi:hypothetical protein